MAELIGAVLVASLVGSLHCAGMCGAFAAFAVLPPRAGVCPSRGSGGVRLQVAYHGGRLVTYAALGAAAGALGAALNLGGSLVGAGRVAGIAAGALMLAFGAVALLRILGARIPVPSVPVLGPLVRRGWQVVSGWPPFLRALSIGLLTALLPCGWLWAFVVAAAGTGSPFLGAATLLAFWAGTVPILAAMGAGFQTLARRLGLRVQAAAALVVIALGILSIVGRWDLSSRASAALGKPPGDLKDATRRVESLGDERPPCCRQ